jgi:hypothetical protein
MADSQEGTRGGKARSSWTRSGGGTASSVKHCDITCTAGSSNRPFDLTPPDAILGCPIPHHTADNPSQLPDLG